jgi:hypothetical protein
MEKTSFTFCEREKESNEKGVGQNQAMRKPE